MKVLTLDSHALREHCRRLQEQVSRDYSPDLIVGIATGGTVVAAEMYGELPHVDVTCRRPASVSRRRTEQRYGILKRLPVWLLNLMRIAQMRLLQLKRNPHRAVEPVDEATLKAIRGARRILLVDDSVDSGITLRNVLNTLRSVEGEREIRSAAITVTLPNPKVRPDYTIYDEGMLCRFPWSNDALA
ncbi:MAG: phosphoribosyltransferase domain-containing protein [Muribaculaceae bacterium]|nr:phosphoribosyltransferase domain-containing protein [Muribaculaceae bacterium]